MSMRNDRQTRTDNAVRMLQTTKRPQEWLPDADDGYEDVLGSYDTCALHTWAREYRGTRDRERLVRELAQSARRMHPARRGPLPPASGLPIRHKVFYNSVNAAPNFWLGPDAKNLDLQRLADMPQSGIEFNPGRPGSAFFHIIVPSPSDPSQFSIELARKYRPPPPGFASLPVLPPSPTVRASALVFRSGEVVLTGSPTVDAAALCAHAICLHLQRLGVPCQVHDFGVQNIVINVRLPFDLDLAAMHDDMPAHVSYSPDDFPLAHMRLGNGSKIVSLFSKKGSAIFTGARTPESARKHLRTIYPLLVHYAAREGQSITQQQRRARGEASMRLLGDLQSRRHVVDFEEVDRRMRFNASGGTIIGVTPTTTSIAVDTPELIEGARNDPQVRQELLMGLQSLDIEQRRQRLIASEGPVRSMGGALQGDLSQGLLERIEHVPSESATTREIAGLLTLIGGDNNEVGGLLGIAGSALGRHDGDDGDSATGSQSDQDESGDSADDDDDVDDEDGDDDEDDSDDNDDDVGDDNSMSDL